MAISATNSTRVYPRDYSGSSSYYYTITASFTETSYSEANNTSTISLSGSFACHNASFDKYINFRLYWHDDKTNTDNLVASYDKWDPYDEGGASANPSKSLSGTYTATHKDDGSLNGYAKFYYTLNDPSSSNQNSWTPNPPYGSVSTSTTPLTPLATGKIYLKLSNGWTNGQTYVKTGTNTWSKAKAVYIKTSDGWKQAK